MSTPPRHPVIPIQPVGPGPLAAKVAAASDDAAHFVSMYQKAPDIYPRSVHGWFAGWRWFFVWLTQLFFYGMPWLQWNGRQLLLFDIEAQRFFIGGLVLYPQDLIYLAALLVLSALSLFLFTAVAGRLWCGYSCPQTVYTEIFMWVERHTEGDRIARMRLDQGPWSMEKLLRKGGKHAAWLAIGLLTGFSFVGYFTPIRELAQAALAFAVSPWNGFWIVFYGLATYGNAGFLREQICKYMCPYARFQSALIDKDSLVITYDPVRGEPRGSRSRKLSAAEQGKGDCIDCTLCVQVCPTGIDIRNGLQNECIGCAACIDVCNGVMAKMDYPEGLIRYATENGVAGGWTRAQMFRRALRPRVLVYAALLGVAASAFTASVALRKPFQFDVIKDRGTLGRLGPEGSVENAYRLQVMNRSEAPQRFRVSAHGADKTGAQAGNASGVLEGLTVEAPELRVPAAGIESIVVTLRLPAEQAQALAGRSMPITFDVTMQPDAGDPTTKPGVSQREKSAFYVPR